MGRRLRSQAPDSGHYGVASERAEQKGDRHSGRLFRRGADPGSAKKLAKKPNHSVKLAEGEELGSNILYTRKRIAEYPDAANGGG
jgi:hypothetical protein